MAKYIIEKILSVNWKEPRKSETGSIPEFTRGRSNLENWFIHEIDHGEEKEKLNYCWQLYAKMICLFFGLLFITLILVTTVLFISFIYIFTDDDSLGEDFKCPWRTLCPKFDQCWSP